MTDLVRNAEVLNLLVIGDIIIDETINTKTKRISPEAPVLISQYENNSITPGGAANVAINIASTGVKCTLFGFIGRSEHTAQFDQILLNKGVNNEIIHLNSDEAIIKIR